MRRSTCSATSTNNAATVSHAVFAALTALLLVALVPAAPVSAQVAPRELWHFDTRDASFGQTAAGDIDGDGRLELVFGCYRNDSSIYALNAEDGSLLWKFNARAPGGDGCNDAAPLLVDANDDGRLDVIVASSCNPLTYCFDGATGAVMWAAPSRGSDSPPSAADIDGDGRLEILHGEFGGYVLCLNAEDGSVAWELPVDTRSWIQTAPTLLDADADGALDLVVATWTLDTADPNTIRAYRCSDRALLWSRPVAKVAYHGTAVSDLDGDGLPELAIGDYSGTLTVLNAEDGSTAWTVPSAGPGHTIGGPVSIGDLNGDGACEVVAASWYRMMALTRDGALLWEHTIDGYASTFRGAALADVDGDALADVIFGTSSGKLTALAGTTGAELWTVDLAAAYGDARFTLDNAPIIADFDADGDLDVFIVGGHTDFPNVAGNFGRAYALAIDRGAGPPWLMFQQNAMRTGSICGNAPASVVERNSPQRGASIVISSDEIVVEARALRSCRLYDVRGELVRDVAVGSTSVTVELTRVAAGVYLLRVDDGGVVEVRRFVRY